MNICNIHQDKFEEIIQIYKEGIETGIATFETKLPSWEIWNLKYLPFARILAMDNEKVIGWAALSLISNREVYRGVAEVSIYTKASFRNQKVGFFLLKHLINTSEQNGIWSLQSSIFKENEASLRLHLSCGFRVVGFKEKIAKIRGVWKDNILLEKRSVIVGIL